MEVLWSFLYLHPQVPLIQNIEKICINLDKYNNWNQRRSMDKIRITILILVAPIFILIFIGHDMGYQQTGDFLSVTLDPYVLLTWPCLFAALILSARSHRTVSDDLSPWWRGAISFIVDFACLLFFITIPLSLLILISEIGGFPPPWQIEGMVNGHFSFIYTPIFFALFFILWVGIGLALDSRITTPGAVITGIHIEAPSDVPLLSVMLFGVFSYYGLFIPIFKIFSFGTIPKVYLCKP